ncbi:MAG TPA: hypothetical protein P5114_06935 [Hyphomicrobiaceae bacterium]|nr:hypothetical protein [Hyphomicrobiaceae bacterium]
MQTKTRRSVRANSAATRATINTVLMFWAVRALMQQHLVVQALLVGLMLPPAVVALYLIKSALGIDLMAGPSPLHHLFYHWIR